MAEPQPPSRRVGRSSKHSSHCEQGFLRSHRSITFALGAYDHARPLTIDPYLTYSTYLGGNGADGANGLAVDSSGNTYITGSTTSTDFPVSGGYQPSNGGGIDAFVTKLNATGTALVYSTYLGGRLNDYGTRIAVDANGNAYISATSTSGNYPTLNYYQRQNKGGEDTVITRLNSTGSALVYSSYLGGRDRDWGNAIAIDGSGNAYLAGETQPPSCGLGCSPTTIEFPTKNAYDSTGNGWADAVVAKFNTNSSGATSLVYSTYLGGTNGDGGYGISLDGSGNAYVTGVTWYRQGFPLVNPYQSDISSSYGEDAFVTKFNASGNGLIYSTYLGGHYRPGLGDGIEVGNGITVDTAGSAYVTGQASSLDFPVVNAVQSAKYTTGSDYDAFVTKFDPPGNTVSYSTYLGGDADDIATRIAIDTTGNASVAGKTASTTGFPLVDAYQATNQGSDDAFVTRFNASGSALLYSTYLGGSGSDSANGLAVNNSGDTYVAGITASANFPTTPGAYRTTGNSGDSAFISKLTDNTPKVNECYGGGNPVIYTTQPAGCGDPVDTATGNYWDSYTDISIPGRSVPLQFSRTYNSLAAAAGITSALGYGWTYSYNMYIDRDAQNNYVVHQENGSVASFRSDFSAPPRVMATLASANGQLVFTRIHGQDKFYFQTMGNPNVYRLVSIVDRKGFTTALTYANGLLQRVSETPPLGTRYLQFTYTGQMLTQVQEFVGGVGGRYVVFTQDGSSDLRTARDVGGQVTHYDDYQNHLLQTITDPNNGSIQNTFDNSGRLLTQTDPMLHPPVRLSYTGSPLSTSTRMTNTLGLVTVHDYDAGKLTKVTQYPGANEAVTRYSYHPGTNYVATVTDPLTHPWQSSWDAFGNLLSETDPLLHTTSYAYNATNDLVVVTNTANIPTTYGYDSYGTLTSVSRPLTQTGQTKTITYGRDYSAGRIGDLRSVTDPRTHIWHYTYDDYGYLDTFANPLN